MMDQVYGLHNKVDKQCYYVKYEICRKEGEKLLMFYKYND